MELSTATVFGRSAFALLAVVSLGAIAAPPPIAAFSKPEQIRSATLSPDGKRIAYITYVAGENIAVVAEVSNIKKLVPVLRPEKGTNLDLTWCRWGNDTRLVCAFSSNFATSEGNAFQTTKLAAVNADGTDIKELMKNLRVDLAQFRDGVLDWTFNDPRTVLVQAIENQQQTGTFIKTFDVSPSVFKLDIYTGGLTKMVPSYPGIQVFGTDGNGEVRLGSGMLNTKRSYFGRLLGDVEWHRLSKVDMFDRKDALAILRVIPGTNKAYAVGGNNGRQALWEVDLEDKLSPRLIFEHPLVDINYFEYERTTGKLLGYLYETDRPFFQYEDDRLGSVMAGINKAMPTTFNRTISFTDDFKKFIIQSLSDVNGGAYYYFDATTHKLQELGKAYPELDPKTLGQTRAITYPAKDGTPIPAFLTVPIDQRAEKLPLVVLPHGGPEMRTRWQFGLLRQFLASRGYAVLEMNFRGSSGYGTDWLKVAHQEWGGLSFADVHDGTLWAISQGIADPKRICIAGEGYGGYAALLGAARHSDVYKCAASLGGFADLPLFLDDRQSYNNPDYLKELLGSDRDKLKENSPSYHAKDIAIPVLIVHGTLDSTVPFAQSKSMASALTIAKKSHKFVEIKGANHFFEREAERETMFGELDVFLSTYLSSSATR